MSVAILEPGLLIDVVDYSVQNNSLSLPLNPTPRPNSPPSRLMGHQLAQKTIQGVTKRKAAEAPLEVKVGFDFFSTLACPLLIYIPLDSPLPESRMSNGGIMLGIGGELILPSTFQDFCLIILHLQHQPSLALANLLSAAIQRAELAAATISNSAFNLAFWGRATRRLHSNLRVQMPSGDFVPNLATGYEPFTQPAPS